MSDYYLYALGPVGQSRTGIRPPDIFSDAIRYYPSLGKLFKDQAEFAFFIRKRFGSRAELDSLLIQKGCWIVKGSYGFKYLRKGKKGYLYALSSKESSRSFPLIPNLIRGNIAVIDRFQLLDEVRKILVKESSRKMSQAELYRELRTKGCTWLDHHGSRHYFRSLAEPYAGRLITGIIGYGDRH